MKRTIKELTRDRVGMKFYLKLLVHCAAWVVLWIAFWLVLYMLH